MNASEAINKIADLLGLKFKSESFTITKLVDEKTTVTNNMEKPFTVGDTLLVVGEDSVLTPAPAGEHTTRDGLCLYVGEDSVIYKIELEEEKEKSKVEESEVEIKVETEDDTMEKVEMAKAKLADGTEIETDESGEFAVGQKLFVITEGGDKTKAPEGEHTTESGIVLTVDGEGVITGVKYPDKEGEGSLEAKKDYETDIKKMKEAMEEMFNLMSNFSKDFESYKKDYEEFKSSPVHEKPVLRKTFGQENILDAKVEFLKNALKNK
jgi:hypothetical protein